MLHLFHARTQGTEVIMSSKADAKERHLLNQAYRNLGPMLLVNFAAVTGISFVLAGRSDAAVHLWTTIHLTAVFVRAGIWLSYELNRRSGQFVAHLRAWQIAYAGGLLLSGMLWAWLGTHIFASSSQGQIGIESYAVLIVLSALAGGASGVTSSYLKVGIAYISLLLLPASACLILAQGTEQTLGALGLTFWLVMIAGLSANHRVLMRNLTLEDANLHLIDRLKGTNLVLEEKVTERTLRLEHLALTDALTGLPNRHGLLDWLNRRELEGSSEKVAVFFLDLDRFKQINDALGHDVGDRVLATVSHQIQSVIPLGARLARWGGDEFVLACPYEGAVEPLVSLVSTEVSRAVNLPLTIEGMNLKLGVSIGWSCFPDEDKSFAEVIHAADLAATEVKRNGRGGTLAFSETIAETLRRRFDLSRSLSSAIGTEALHLVYQPIINAQTKEVTAYEALCRWNHADLGAIRPDEFIRLAEDTDRIIALGNWVLEQACTDAAEWRRAGINATVAVNASIKQLTEPNFQLRLVHILGQSGLAPAMLEIEVTESVFDDDHIDQVVRTLDALKVLGIKVHIDDFGTGYSSLSRLRRLSVDAIKIDRSFVSDLTGQSQVIIESTLLIARAFGLKVIAEGVETERQCEKLRAIGVDQLQGFYFGKPAPLGRLLAKHIRNQVA